MLASMGVATECHPYKEARVTLINEKLDTGWWAAWTGLFPVFVR